jgi:hypothetical protein
VELHIAVINDENRQPVGTSHNDDRVAAAALARKGKAAAGERVVDAIRQWTPTDDRKFG